MHVWQEIQSLFCGAGGGGRNVFGKEIYAATESALFGARRRLDLFSLVFFCCL